MPNTDWVKQLDSEIQSLVEEYVKLQDFHALETHLKKDKQFKDELRADLFKKFNFQTFTKGMVNALQVIRIYLPSVCADRQRAQIQQEIEQAFKKLGEIAQKASLQANNQEETNSLNQNMPIWTAVFGISDSTLLTIYEIVLKCFNNHEIENAQDIIGLLLLFAPTIPSYWNALGFCCQERGNFEEALNFYLMAEDIDQNHMDTHFYLARCYIALNQKLLAQEQVEKLYKLVNTSKEMLDQSANQVEQLAREIGV